MKHKKLLLIAIMTIILLGGGNALLLMDIGPIGTRTVTDMAGRTVSIPSKIERIVGVGAGALRILVYLETTDLVVGVETIEHTSNNARPYNIAHPRLLDLPSIGPMHGGDPELIVAQTPDVIFWTYAQAGDANDLQSKTGIPVIVLSYGDLEAQRTVFYESLELTAYVLNKEERVSYLINYFDNMIADLDNRTKAIDAQYKPSVYVGGVNYRGAHGLTSTRITYAPFTFTNSLNVASNLTGDHVFIDSEQLIDWDPDVIFVDQGGLNLVISDLKNTTAFYSTLTAVKNGDLYCVLPYNFYTGNMGTILADTYYVGSILYPEYFIDIDPIEKAGEIYTFLVGYNVYPTMTKTFGGFYKLELD